jgi:hypothetical protein
MLKILPRNFFFYFVWTFFSSLLTPTLLLRMRWHEDGYVTLVTACNNGTKWENLKCIRTVVSPLIFLYIKWNVLKIGKTYAHTTTWSTKSRHTHIHTVCAVVPPSHIRRARREVEGFWQVADGWPVRYSINKYIFAFLFLFCSCSAYTKKNVYVFSFLK